MPRSPTTRLHPCFDGGWRFWSWVSRRAAETGVEATAPNPTSRTSPTRSRPYDTAAVERFHGALRRVARQRPTRVDGRARSSSASSDGPASPARWRRREGARGHRDSSPARGRLARRRSLAEHGGRPAPRGAQVFPMYRSVDSPTEGESTPSPLLDRALQAVRAAAAALGAKRLLVVAAVVWAAEIFWVQEHKLRAGYTSEYGVLRLLAERCVRLAFDLSFSLGVLALLPRALLFLPLVAWQILAALLLGYHAYFDRALSWQTIVVQLEEGLAVAGMGTGILGGPAIAGLLVALGVKVALALWARRRGTPARALGGCALGGWLCMAGALNLVYPLQKLQVYSSMERTGVAYGYFWTWVGEALYMGETLLERAIEAAETRRSDRLAVEPLPPPADRVVILQVESLDDALLGHEESGELVVPFLTRLREASAYYRVRPIHDNGSADADFSMLTGRAPSPDVITYRLLHYPYGAPLPKIFRRP